MKYNALSIFLCIAIFFFSACKKHDNTDLTVTPPSPPAAVVEMEISGIVLNTNGSSAEGVEVTIEGKKLTTAENGYFEYKGSVANPDKVKLTLAKNGFFTYTKILTVDKYSSLDGLRFKLIPELVAGSFEAANGGTVSNNYVALVFQPNSFTKLDGSNYLGMVTVKIPANRFNESNRQFPGDVRGLTATNQKVVLESWGGMEVEIYSASGEKLKLSKAVNYTYQIGYQYVYIRNPVKLWAFNEADGIWTESGAANLVGQTFTGSTVNLSYLQWAYARPSALFRSRVQDKNLNVPAGFEFFYAMSEFNSIGIPSTNVNSRGNVLLYVPALTNLRTGMFSPCTDRIETNYTTPAIPEGITGGTTYTVDLAPFLTSVTGTVEDCDFKPLNGRAELAIDGKKINSVLLNGAFNLSFIGCGRNSGTLTIFDGQDKVIYQNNTFSPNRGYKNNLPPITTCTKPLIGSFSIKAEGITYNFQSPQDDIKFQTIQDYSGSLITAISANNDTRGESFYLTYIGQSAGNFNVYTCQLKVPKKSYFLTWGLFTPGIVNITRYKTGNTLLEGSFKTNTNLNFDLSNTNKIVELTGTFKVSN
ncbi:MULTISPECIES: hypothetical protein [unclassified Pedobacter]|uniref:hypothetical protein n=1 Tax=unclassified Pedobacter TaxID=2628915 RepID=UPI001422B00D|nr:MULTISPECIES: hypothetical protein [unclassified Pedobacter]NII84266.1 hypothetical protein [Pedobacter sp. SG908]NMN38819.1 hypothetical protein [Pedobacter sp. SG918]